MNNGSLPRRSLSLLILRVGCPVGAVLCGELFLWLTGAPGRYLTLNGAALPAGLVLPGLVRRGRRFLPGDAVSVALGSLLLATALWGFSIGGVTRWWRVGGLSLHVGLVLLPTLLIEYARRPNGWRMAGVGLALLATTLQPDRATAGAALAGAASVAVARRDRPSLAVAMLALVAFGVTLLRPDRLPPAIYVEGVLATAAGSGLALAGVVAGWLLLLAPAWPALQPVGAGRGAFGAFGATWLAFIGAAVLGDYPMPVIGYGGSAILGYCLSLAALPGRLQAPRHLSD